MIGHQDTKVPKNEKKMHVDNKNIQFIDCAKCVRYLPSQCSFVYSQVPTQLSQTVSSCVSVLPANNISKMCYLILQQYYIVTSAVTSLRCSLHSTNILVLTSRNLVFLTPQRVQFTSCSRWQSSLTVLGPDSQVPKSDLGSRFSEEIREYCYPTDIKDAMT